jgi:hypothetical protein
MKSISIEAYAKKIGYKGDNPTIEEIQEFAENVLDCTLWDYPLEEYDYVLKEVKDNCADELILVETEIGIRVCELL